MIDKKKIKYLENNYNTPLIIHPKDKQNKYIDLFKQNLFKTRVAEPIDPITNSEGLKRAYLQPNSLYIHGDTLFLLRAVSLDVYLRLITIDNHGVMLYKMDGMT